MTPDGNFGLQRSRAEWGVRCVAAVVIAAVGMFVVAQSRAHVALARGDAALAYTLAPWDGSTSAALSEAMTLAGQTGTRAKELARAALRLDPTQVKAVTTLATGAVVARQVQSSNRLFAYSQQLSRRDLATQLWAIENAVARSNVADALEHYDIALRTMAKAPDILFPILSQAIADPEIQTELVKRLAEQPSWSDNFINYISTAGADPKAAAQLFAALQRSRIDVPPETRAQLVNTLVTRNLHDVAWAIYSSDHPGAYRTRSRDPNFSAEMTVRSAFDWVAVGGSGVSASIQRTGSTGLFDFATGANFSGPLLQQLQLLSPGRYRLDGRSTGIDQPLASLPYWTLRCQADGRDLGRVVVRRSIEQGGKFFGDFTVPLDCNVQMLLLAARPTDALAGVAGQIREISLRPESSR